MPSEKVFPIVDVFAGPGGLGEGFASLDTDAKSPRFENVLSIERDLHSFRTLHLRHFLRSFPEYNFPDDYYDFLRGSITLWELYSKFPIHRASADRSAIQVSLGPENHDFVRATIGERLKNKSKWVLVGGPPCQAYSLVGRSRMMGDPEFESDIRHFLYREYLQLIIDHAPPVFIMENVKGLLSAKVNDEFVIDRMLADLASPRSALERGSNGFRYRLYSLSEDELPGLQTDPKLFLVKAEEFGVPQARHRMFILGVRNDIDVIPNRLKRHAAPTLKETIGGLPGIRSGLSKGRDSLSNWWSEIAAIDTVSIGREMNGHKHADDLIKAINISIDHAPPDLERQSTRYSTGSTLKHDVLDRIHDGRLDVLDAHNSRSHMPSDLRRYAFATTFAAVTGKSPVLADFPASLLPQHNNVALGRQGKMFSDRFRVQLPDRPATTVTSHISKDGHYFIHYDPVQCRSLTVREAARLQTFPDNYRFEGPRTAQYHQVGNAVPPYLAQQIAEIVADVLERMMDDSP